MWAHITEMMDDKALAEFEWKLDRAFDSDRARTTRRAAPAPVPDTPGENIAALMKAMSTGTL